MEMREVRLVAATEADRAAVHAWMCAPGVVEHMMGPPRFPEQSVPSFEEFCEDWQPWFWRHDEPARGRAFLIMSGDEPVGMIAHNAVVTTRGGARATELDLWLRAAGLTGRGFGRAAVATLCERLAGELDVDVVFLQPSARNPRAVRAYEAAGFARAPLQGDAASLWYRTAADYHDSVFLVRHVQRHVKVVRLPDDFDRAQLLPLLRLADEAEEGILAYRDAGVVHALLETGERLVGEVLAVTDEARHEAELVSVAVAASHRRRGLGTRLVREVLARLRAEGVARVSVATAAADIENLAFYQRLGFRFRAIERDWFTAARGYSPGLVSNGIPLCDRVVLDIESPSPAAPFSSS